VSAAHRRSIESRTPRRGHVLLVARLPRKVDVRAVGRSTCRRIRELSPVGAARLCCIENTVPVVVSRVDEHRFPPREHHSHGISREVCGVTAGISSTIGIALSAVEQNIRAQGCVDCASRYQPCEDNAREAPNVAIIIESAPIFIRSNNMPAHEREIDYHLSKILEANPHTTLPAGDVFAWLLWGICLYLMDAAWEQSFRCAQEIGARTRCYVIRTSVGRNLSLILCPSFRRGGSISQRIGGDSVICCTRRSAGPVLALLVSLRDGKLAPVPRPSAGQSRGESTIG